MQIWVHAGDHQPEDVTTSVRFVRGRVVRRPAELAGLLRLLLRRGAGLEGLDHLVGDFLSIVPLLLFRHVPSLVAGGAFRDRLQGQPNSRRYKLLADAANIATCGRSLRECAENCPDRVL